MPENKNDIPTISIALQHQKKRAAVFEKVYRSMSKGIGRESAKTAREWLSKKGLSPELTGAAYNSAQMHYRKREFAEDLKNIGF